MFDDDDDVNGYGAPFGDLSVNYSFTMISYLDYTEESTKDVFYMRDDDYDLLLYRLLLVFLYMQLRMLCINKKTNKICCESIQSSKKRVFLCEQSKDKSWRIICKIHMFECDWMIHFREILSGMWKA
ncbi:hypothetical protein R3W88_029878 [Solanum pinnatisectum]|uniref:Uncharacterized protein n=1 Tax=Solanum pinnatisectum TaxID=50273 RepID=A0AAV9K6K9_9SOLN|nr:hypothetical protein R3W88_029878 [Solanum pinnatisectum]